MRDSLLTWAIRGGWVLSLAACLAGATVRAQEASSPESNFANDWLHYDWLKPVEDQQQAASGGTLSATAGQNIADPFTVLSTGSLYQEKYDSIYTHPVADTFSLFYETSAVTLSDGSNPYLPLSSGPDDLSRGQKAGLQFQPVPGLTLKGNVHDSSSDASVPASFTTTNGAGFTAEGHLPFNSVLTLGANSDRTTTDPISGIPTTCDNAYDAQWEQPLGKMPLTAVLKGHYEETTTAGVPTTSLPSAEQSLVWKPAQDTTVKMGLRQQRYQNFPGMSSDFNEALFADWSQKVSGDVTWHSYTEMLDARSNLELAPGVSTSGANGVPQSSTPGGPSVSSAVPLVAQDKTFTFSTGPSFRLEKDISASIEYSNRWDPNPVAGSVGQEQRLSVSVKGSF